MQAISLYSGAGGLDVGFKKAGFDILWANDFDKNAIATYQLNLGNHAHLGNIDDLKETLFNDYRDLDVVFGGPPCQGFSVAGKMDPHDPRSKHIWVFLEIVQKLRPKVFVMENVKALGQLQKWEPLREELLHSFRNLGYSTNYIILNATEFNVPQARERVFFVGFKTGTSLIPDLDAMLNPYRVKAPTVRQALAVLDKAGYGNNSSVCKAKITLAEKPVLRKSPYAGMIFNGLGRPLKINGYSATLPASMGGNKTPIIDEEELYNNSNSWVEDYHKQIMSKTKAPQFTLAPDRLRRITVEEAAILQTFPLEYKFAGSQSSKFKQIGNAVPCNLGYAVAQMVSQYLSSNNLKICKSAQLPNLLFS